MDQRGAFTDLVSVGLIPHMKSVYEIRKENLSTLIKECAEGSQTTFAQRMGFGQPNLVSRYVRGKKNIGANLARKFEHSCGKPENWLDVDRSPVAQAVPLDEPREVSQGEHFYMLPVNDKQLSAGPGVRDYRETIGGSIAMRKDFLDAEGLNVPDLETWFVEGESMMEILRPGDMVIINKGIQYVINGEMYAFHDEKGGSRIKYIHEQRDGSLLLLSENPKFPPETIPVAHRQDISICGIVEIRSGRVRRTPR